MNIDIVILILLVVYLGLGFRGGFIEKAGNLAGLLIGTVAATFLLKWFQEEVIAIPNPIWVFILFIAIVFLLSQLLSILTNIIAKTWKIIEIIPLTGIVNRLLGAILALLEALLVLGSFTYIITNYFEHTEVFQLFSTSYSYMIGNFIAQVFTFLI